MSMLPSSARSLRPREASSPSAHSLTPEWCEAKTPGENTCPLVGVLDHDFDGLGAGSECRHVVLRMGDRRNGEKREGGHDEPHEADHVAALLCLAYACGREGSVCRRSARSAREVAKPCPLFRFVDALLLSLPPRLSIDFLIAPATDAGTDPSSSSFKTTP